MPATGIMAEEPVAILTAALIATINAGVILGNVMDWFDLTTEQTTALVAFITAVSTLVGAVIRMRVYAPATVAALLESDTP